MKQPISRRRIRKNVLTSSNNAISTSKLNFATICKYCSLVLALGLAAVALYVAEQEIHRESRSGTAGFLKRISNFDNNLASDLLKRFRGSSKISQNMTELLPSSIEKSNVSLEPILTDYHVNKNSNTIGSLESTVDTNEQSKQSLISNAIRKEDDSSSGQNNNQSKKKKKKKFVPIPDWIDPSGPFDEGKYIKLMPSRRGGIRQDRGVDFSNMTFPPHQRPPGNPSGVPGYPRAYNEVLQLLASHPLSSLSVWEQSPVKSPSLVDVLIALQESPSCRSLPIFLTMATVGDELYWQLIENFVYTMARFQVLNCTVVICITDAHCMDLCRQNNFPCYDYQYEKKPVPHVMEQIAVMKLYLLPQALAKGVNMFMLDLDVGFLQSPLLMTEAFRQSPVHDIFVQEDMIFLMNRSTSGWKTWYTDRLPNIGLFLCRGNDRTVKMFDISWKKYVSMDDVYSRTQVGKDQNHVLDAMRFGRAKFGLKYAYFPNTSAMLMDKVFKFNTTKIEIGGKITGDMLWDYRTVAMHATCYEHITKVMALKATNAFWHPRYYDPLRPTITKQLLYINTDQLLDEVRSLVYLALKTNRSLIIPNVLGTDRIFNQSLEQIQGQNLWPGFRVLYLKREHGKTVLPVQILEPAFYWRVSRDYDEPPAPYIQFFHPKDSLASIERTLQDNQQHPRIVLHASHSSNISPRSASLGELTRSQKMSLRRAGIDPDVYAKSSNSRFLMEEEITVVDPNSFDGDDLDSNIDIELEDLSSKSQTMDPPKSHSRESLSESEGGLSNSGDSDQNNVISLVSKWANGETGLFSRPFKDECKSYGVLPSVKQLPPSTFTTLMLQKMRTCEGIFSLPKGNRTCFQICD